MMKINKKGYFIIILILYIIFNLSLFIKASEFNSDEYKTSNYVLSLEEMKMMVNKYQRLVQSENDKAPDDKYVYFVGYDSLTHKAYYTNKNQIKLNRSLEQLNIKTVGTWRYSDYYGQIMQDTKGIYYYCAGMGKIVPVGNYSFKVSNSSNVIKALSWAFPTIKVSNNEQDYARSQLAIWAGLNQLPITTSKLGKYENVFKAMKNKIGENNKSFNFEKNAKNEIINNINMSSAIKMSGDASYKVSDTMIKSLESNKINLYIYNNASKSYEKIKANTFYSPSKYSLLRIGSGDLGKSVNNIEIKLITNQMQNAGFLYENSNSNYQSLYSTLNKTISDKEYKINFSLENQLGNVELYKEGDDVDLYESSIMKNNKVLYASKDNSMVVYDDDKLISKVLKYPSKDEMIVNDLFNKVINYEYVDYEIVKEKVVKLDENNMPIQKKKVVNKMDENGNYISKIDSNGNIVLDSNNNPVYETEEVLVFDENNEAVYEMVEQEKRDENGNLIVKTLYNSDGSYKMVNASLSFNYPTKKEMDNIKALKGVEFSLTGNNKSYFAKSDDKGIVRFENVLPGKYVVKETKAIDNYVLDEKMYNVEVEKNKTSYVNNKVAIINYKNVGKVLINKKDSNGLNVENVIFDITNKDNQIVASVQTKKDGNATALLEVGQYNIKERVAPLKYNNEGLVKNIDIDTNKTSYVNYVNTIKYDEVDIAKLNDVKKNIANAKICIVTKNNDLFDIKVNNKSMKIKKYCYLSSNKDQKIYLGMQSYFIYEEKAPLGYIKSDKKQYLEVKGFGKKNRIVIVNKAISLPKTSINNE